MNKSFNLLSQYPQYLSKTEGVEVLELAHLFPRVPETLLSIYIGINDAVCNKGLVTPFLPRHAHNNVFAFDPDIFSSQKDVPAGTIDAKAVINDFVPPNNSWHKDWTYVMIADPKLSFNSLWQEKGYIDMIPAKFEDFTMVSDHNKSKVCTFIDPEAFEHPVNLTRDYLITARERGEKTASEYSVPELLKGETKNLAPVILNQGEKLYVARPDFQPCDHCWSNIHPDNEEISEIQKSLDIEHHSLEEPFFTKKYRKPIMLAVLLALFNQLSGIN